MLVDTLKLSKFGYTRRYPPSRMYWLMLGVRLAMECTCRYPQSGSDSTTTGLVLYKYKTRTGIHLAHEDPKILRF
jgi:hypothetical protein